MIRRQPRHAAGTPPATRPLPRAEREPVIRLASVVKTYGTGEAVVHALRGVSLDVVERDYVAIMGASGSGKSTMMNIIGCLDVPSRGWYWLDGVDVRILEEDDLSKIRNRKIGFGAGRSVMGGAMTGDVTAYLRRIRRRTRHSCCRCSCCSTRCWSRH